MTDSSLMPFGRYKGQKLANVPPDYLIWLYDNNKCNGELKQYIFDNLEVLQAEINANNNHENRNH